MLHQQTYANLTISKSIKVLKVIAVDEATTLMQLKITSLLHIDGG
jgi:hypothetical protein